MMIGGAVVNALAFTGSINFVSSLKSSAIEKERKRHDLALERLMKARDKWSKERLKYLDYLNDRLRKEANTKKINFYRYKRSDERMLRRYRQSVRS